MPAFDQKKNLIVIRKVIVLMRDHAESRSKALSAMMATGITANPKSWPKTAYNRSVFTPKLPKSTMSFGHGDSLEYEQTIDRAQQFCDAAASISDNPFLRGCKRPSWWHLMCFQWQWFQTQ